MTIELGSSIPDDLRAVLEDPRFETLAVPLLTVDTRGYPHVAMISWLEIISRGPRQLAFFLHAGSRTTQFLDRQGRCTLVLADRPFVYYLKGRAQLWERDGPVAVFDFTIHTVLEDRPTREEDDTRLVSGIRFQAPKREIDRRRALRASIAKRLEQASNPSG